MDDTAIDKIGHDVKDHWMIEPNITYLNHGAFGALSIPVYNAAIAVRRYIEGQPARFLKDEVTQSLRDSASILAKYVGADGNDIVFVDNATTAINAVLRSLVLLPGDEVVTTNHSYGAVLKTLEFICERAGARIVFADIPYPLNDEAIILDAINNAITKRTKLVVVDHITSMSALPMPIKKIASQCGEKNIPILVDGAHAVGILDIDLNNLGVNWYAGNCHKWLGAPRGCGFLWTKEFNQRLVRPTTISHYISDGYLPAFDWPGSKDFTPYLCVAAAIKFRKKFGENKIRKHCHSTIWDGLNILKDAFKTELGASEALTTYMGNIHYPIKIKADKKNAEILRKSLRDKHNIEIDVKAINGKLWIRNSAYLYNNLDDFKRLAMAIKP